MASFHNDLHIEQEQRTIFTGAIEALKLIQAHVRGFVVRRWYAATADGPPADAIAGVEEVDVSPWAGPGMYCVVLPDVFSPAECEALIARAERQGFEDALVNTGGGRQTLITDIRNSRRAIIDDAPFAEELWQRILARCGGDARLRRRDSNAARGDARAWTAVGANERLRFLRYDEGNYFASHMDGCYVRGREAGAARAGERSFVTAQLYLNEGFEGGATRFMSTFDERVGVDVVPRTGAVLLFQHDLCHEGALLVSGRKYAIRTDIMFTSKGEGHSYAERPIELDAPPPASAEKGASSLAPDVLAALQAEKPPCSAFDVPESERITPDALQSRRAQLAAQLLGRRRRRFNDDEDLAG